jgi:hypothetical protein
MVQAAPSTIFFLYVINVGSTHEKNEYVFSYLISVLCFILSKASSFFFFFF